jgi:small-conductance mechanosensitive channel
MGFLEPAWHSIRLGWHAFVANLPALALAALAFLAAWTAGAMLARLVREGASRYGHDPTLGRALGNLTKFAAVLVGFLVAITLAVPSVKVADALGFLGLSGVAVGFAFKDIFQNFLAGLLILLRKPFQLGDQIASSGFEGMVEDINLRSTIVKTYAGERVVIPNSDVYQDPVVVRTAYGLHRDALTVGIDYGADLRGAKAALQAAVPDVPGVLAEPAPWVRTAELAHNCVNLEVFYWTTAPHHATLEVRDRVAIAVYEALSEAGIRMGPHPD